MGIVDLTSLEAHLLRFRSGDQVLLKCAVNASMFGVDTHIANSDARHRTQMTMEPLAAARMRTTTSSLKPNQREAVASMRPASRSALTISRPCRSTPAAPDRRLRQRPPNS